MHPKPIANPIARICLVFFYTLAFSAQAFPVLGQVQAPSGMPNSAEFGFGGRVDPWGAQVDLAVNVAAGIGLDWIAIDFDWSRLWPDAAGVMDMTTLDSTFQLAAQFQLNVLVSLSNAPAWAMTAAGPDPQKTFLLVSLLANRYPGVLLAVELFPFANTWQGWGSSPDPAAYANLLLTVSQAVKNQASPILIIAGGLAPLDAGHSTRDLDDLVFLRGLYAAGASEYMPVISLRLSLIDGDPMASASEQPRVLRHYEAVRQVMVENNHENGLVWVTAFAWPAALQNGPASAQIRWLNQALLLMKSQLYIGAAFFDRINPPADGVFSAPALILSEGNTSLHPALTTFGQIITLGRSGQDAGFQIFLIKKLTGGTDKNTWKENLP